MKQAVILSFLIINLIVFLGLQSIPAVYAQTAPSHLKYFGYYHVKCSTTALNDIPELGRLNNSNVMMLFTINRFCLAEARKANIKVIAWTDPYFFNITQPQFPTRGRSPLKDPIAYEAGWTQLKNTISGYEDVIYAFYFEEPWWLGVSKEDMWTVNQRMISEYPRIRRMAIEAGISMPNDPDTRVAKVPHYLQYYKYLTDVGMDYYGTDFLSFWDWNPDKYTPYLNSLLSLTSSDQSIWVVPQTFSRLDRPNFDRLGVILNQYYVIARGNSRIAGMLNFLYSPADVVHLGHAAKEFFDPNSPVGLYNEAYKNLHVQIGRAIIANNSTPTPLPTATRTPTPLPSSTPKPTATTIPPSPTITPTPNPCSNGKKGDLNCDGVINNEDLNILNSAWTTSGPVVIPPDARRSPDLNGDNKVDEIDMTTLMRNWTP